MATIKWSTPAALATAIAGAGVSPTLKGLANNNRVLGDAIDNGTARNKYSDWQLLIRGAVAFAAGSVVEVWFVESLDGGTTYEDGAAGVTPAKASAFIVPLAALSTQQRIIIPQIVLPPFLFKPLFVNSSGQALTNTDNENVLSYRTYNDDAS